MAWIRHDEMYVPCIIEVQEGQPQPVAGAFTDEIPDDLASRLVIAQTLYDLVCDEVNAYIYKSRNRG